MSTASPVPADHEREDDPAHQTLAEHYRRQIRGTGREARFVIAFAFLLTFGIVRFVTYSIRYHWLPFLHDSITKNGLHIHHFVYGILLLLAVGYLALAFPEQRGRRVIALALLYGIAAALTLDEFALWLNLADVYWAKQGRASLDAAALGATLFVLGGTGAPLWGALWRDYLRHRRPIGCHNSGSG